MTKVTAVPATPASFQLAEGIVFDSSADVVRWVDIWHGRVLAGRLVGSRIEMVADVSLGETTGAVAVAEDGGLLLAGARGLVAISPEGEVSRGPDLLGSRPATRLNDGCVDPYGNFVVGSLALGPETGREVLLRVSPDGRREILRRDVRLSNGVGFAPDGQSIYHVDTFAMTVSSHSYSPGPFDHEESWVQLPLVLPHYPDGIAISADGGLWVAQWGGSCVRHYAPSGALLGLVAVDAAQVSSAAFVGQNLDTLAITTAQEGLASWGDSSGAIFLADVGTTGVPPALWPGSTRRPYWLWNGED